MCSISWPQQKAYSTQMFDSSDKVERIPQGWTGSHERKKLVPKGWSCLRPLVTVERRSTKHMRGESSCVEKCRNGYVDAASRQGRGLSIAVTGGSYKCTLCSVQSAQCAACRTCGVQQCSLPHQLGPNTESWLRLWVGGRLVCTYIRENHMLHHQSNMR